MDLKIVEVNLEPDMDTERAVLDIKIEGDRRQVWRLLDIIKEFCDDLPTVDD